MKLYCILIVLFISTNFFSIKAYLYVAYGLKSPTNQKISLLGALHKNHTEYDEFQLTATLKIIEETEKLPPDNKLKFYVECPHANIINPLMGAIKSVENGLMYYTKNLDLQNTTIEDCDIRKVSGMAHLLLICPPAQASKMLGMIRDDPEGIARHWRERFGCSIDTLTFKDLLDNHDMLLQQSKSYRNSWKSRTIRKAFDCLLHGSHCGLKIFIHHLTEDDPTLDLNETVLQYSLRYWSTNGQRPHDLIFGLVEAFSDFLDMYTLHQILLLQNDPNCKSIIVCTGSSHSSNIYDALKTIGYRDIIDPIVDDTTVSPPPPLSYEYFMQLLRPSEELEASLTRTEVPGESSGCVVM